MEQAEGISLENVVRLGKPMMHPNDLLAIMHDRWVWICVNRV